VGKGEEGWKISEILEISGRMRRRRRKRRVQI